MTPNVTKFLSTKFLILLKNQISSVIQKQQISCVIKNHQIFYATQKVLNFCWYTKILLIHKNYHSDVTQTYQISIDKKKHQIIFATQMDQISIDTKKLFSDTQTHPVDIQKSSNTFDPIQRS